MTVKPRVFIGSSSEGLAIAEAVFSGISRETEPTLWTNQIFTPGAYPLEALERAVRGHAFAVLVASPDDEVVKRGVSAPAMRDNLLVEFGLFAGALGRRRVFFVCPDEPRLNLPSDLLGILTTTYQAERSRTSASDRAAAVQTACHQIRNAISEEWEIVQKQELERQAKLRASKQSQAIRRLHTVATRLRDTLMALQRDSFAALSDRTAFDAVKKRSAEQVRRIASEFGEDARIVGAHQELDQLASATHEALTDLPFPEELSLGREAVKQKAIGVGLGALNTLLSGGDAVGHVQRAAQGETSGRLSSLSKRYVEWWDRHSPRLHEAAAAMQDGLFNAMLTVSAAQMGPETA
jgi:hypothetical protein